MKTIQACFAVVIISALVAVNASAQGYAGESATYEPTMLIDKPTAGMLKRADYLIYSNLYQRGGVLIGVSVGLVNQFSFGISYGGTDILGSNKIAMNPWPGVKAKLRLIEEGQMMPAIAVGFDSQGKEVYIDSTKRYSIKSPGLYAVASKNYAFLGYLSIHGGINYSFERDDGDRDLNFYVGAEKSVGEVFSILAEYDFATNDDHNSAVGKGKGYLNIGFRLSAAKGLVVGFDLKNITKNQNNITVGNRTMQIDFIGSF